MILNPGRLDSAPSTIAKVHSKGFATKTGVWGFVIDEDPAEVVDVVTSLIAALRQQGESLANLPQVQDAYIDIFVAADADEDGEGSCEMALTELQMKALSDYGLPIRFTVSLGKL